MHGEESFLTSLLDLFTLYSRAESASCLPRAAFDALRDHIQSRMRGQNIGDMQDATENLLDMLLSLAPAFARLVEVTMSENLSTGEQRQTARHSQFLVLPIGGLQTMLQDVVDRYQQVELVEGKFRQQVTIRTTCDTLFIVGNPAPDLLALGPSRHDNGLPNITRGVTIDCKRYYPTGMLLWTHSHFTALVRVALDAWVFFNDQQPQPTVVAHSHLKNFLTGLHDVVFRALVLRTRLTTHAVPATNLPNFANNCYINSMLQLLFHCESFIEALRNEARLSNEQRRLRDASLPGLMRETLLASRKMT
jgi:hypothetical protein